MSASSQGEAQKWRVTQIDRGHVVAACEFDSLADAKRCADWWAQDYSTEGRIVVDGPFQQDSKP